MAHAHASDDEQMDWVNKRIKLVLHNCIHTVTSLKVPKLRQHCYFTKIFIRP